MKNYRKHGDIQDLYNRIVKYNPLFELREFNALSQREKDDIFSKAYKKIFRVDKDEKAQEEFLKAFFSTIHAMRLTIATPEEALIMHRIYNNALHCFPQFARYRYDAQIEIMHEAYMRGRVQKDHDIHVFAKATFMVFAEKGLIDTIVYVDKIENVHKQFNKIYEQRKTRTDCEHPSDVWEYNSLIFVMYEYKGKSGATMRTSFHVSDLWELLTHERN